MSEHPDVDALRERLLIERALVCDVTVPDNDLLHPRSCVRCSDFTDGADAVLAVISASLPQYEQVGWRWRSIHGQWGPAPWIYTDEEPEPVVPSAFTWEVEPVFRPIPSTQETNDA